MMKYYASGKNQRGKQAWSLQGLSGDVAELRLYDVIGWFGIEAIDVIEALDHISESKILVRINSPGGDVMDGNAIFNALRNHNATVETRVDGLAASIAAVIAMAGDNIVMEENSFMMIHNSWSCACGNANDLEHVVGVLRKIDGNMVKTFAGRTGMESDEIVGMCDAETWMTADEAVGFGFADEVKTDEDVEASLAVKVFDLSEYLRVPETVQAKFGKDLPIMKRDAEKALGDLGVGKLAAKVIVSRGYGELAGRDAEANKKRRDAAVDDNQVDDNDEVLAVFKDITATMGRLIEGNK